ncbi:MAG: hypothetical protein A2X49_12550 [Lentisphaerae bacterium GWF2_52_8]|nr:MAG: hypothetical protein A2X49_12550 [Lentisphaerae bacterium GWF2_52_8]
MRQVGLSTIAYGNDNNGCIAGFRWVGGWELTSSAGVEIGTCTNGNPLYPFVGAQLLYKELKYQSNYLWCNDLTYQSILEAGNTSSLGDGARPYYSPSISTESHLSCSTFGLPAGTVIYRSAYYMNGSGATEKCCTHLQRLHLQKPYHLLLGERNHSAYRGPGYQLSVYEKTPYSLYQVAFRHFGPSANFLFFDMHVENWKSGTWAANRIKTTDTSVSGSGRHSWPE